MQSRGAGAHPVRGVRLPQPDGLRPHRGHARRARGGCGQSDIHRFLVKCHVINHTILHNTIVVTVPYHTTPHHTTPHHTFLNYLTVSQTDFEGIIISPVHVYIIAIKVHKNILLPKMCFLFTFASMCLSLSKFTYTFGI